METTYLLSEKSDNQVDSKKIKSLFTNIVQTVKEIKIQIEKENQAEIQKKIAKDKETADMIMQNNQRLLAINEQLITKISLIKKECQEKIDQEVSKRKSEIEQQLEAKKATLKASQNLVSEKEIQALKLKVDCLQQQLKNDTKFYKE